MKKEYWLKKGMIAIPVIIQEDSKEDVKELMDWSEEEFKKRTVTKYVKRSRGEKK